MGTQPIISKHISRADSRFATSQFVTESLIGWTSLESALILVGSKPNHKTILKTVIGMPSINSCLSKFQWEMLNGQGDAQAYNKHILEQNWMHHHHMQNSLYGCLWAAWSKFCIQGLIDNKSALVQVMDWRWTSDKPLLSTVVTKPQKSIFFLLTSMNHLSKKIA